MLTKYICGDDNKKIRGHEFGKGAAEGTEGIKIMGMIQIQNSPKKFSITTTKTQFLRKLDSSLVPSACISLLPPNPYL